MRRMLTGVFALLAAAMLFGFASEASAQMKIGYVFMDDIRMRAQPYQDAQQSLSRTAGERQQEAEQRQSEIQRLQDQLERQASLLTEERRVQRQNEIRQKLMEYEQWAQGAQQELGRQQMQLIQPIDERVLDLVQEIAARRNYDLVIDGTAIAYMKDHDEHNLTELVIEAINAE
jgi:outer membrane protein